MDNKPCKCKVCKEHSKYQFIVNNYVPKKHRKFLEDLYLKMVCAETDSAMADLKIKKLVGAFGIEKVREVLTRR